MSRLVSDLMREASAAHLQGRLVEAEKLASQAETVSPEDPGVQLLLGVLAGKTNRNQDAIRHFLKVLAKEPTSFEAQFWLSTIYRRERQFDLATDYGEMALRLRPNDAYSQNNLGLCYLDLLKLEEAIEHFSNALAIRTDMPQIFHNLGTALYLIGRDREAAEAFDRSLKLAPQSVDSWMSLGQVMISMTNPEVALECGRRAVSLAPNSADAHLLLANSYVECGFTGEAEPHLEQAVRLDPTAAKSHAILGQRRQSMGRFEEANEHLIRSIELEPIQGFAYFAYAHNNKISQRDLSFVEQMEQIAENPTLPPRELNLLFYALGRSYESLGNYERAMRFFDKANDLARKIKFGNSVFDRSNYSRGIDWLINTFTSERLRRPSASGNSSELPILIVGMMRPGTTLMEQMLSSHLSIGAAGESRFWPKNIPRLIGREKRSYKESLLPKLAESYIQSLREVSPDARFVTDKMPANYEFLGPIHLAIPNAKIIHMRRNPVDTCISIYTTPNRVPIDYAYDRGNIVFAYREYRRLMSHWRSVLPSNRFLEITYEDLVQDREGELRKILEFLDLEWDEQVMSHQENQRNVTTPSLWQVRQPIYNTSVERWRRYEPWLREFRSLLEDENEMELPSPRFES